MRYLIVMAALLVGACGKDHTPVTHEFCVLAHPTKVGDERYVCTITAKFESNDACHTWEETVRQKDPAPYKDGRLTTKCKGE